MFLGTHLLVLGCIALGSILIVTEARPRKIESAESNWDSGDSDDKSVDEQDDDDKQGGDFEDDDSVPKYDEDGDDYPDVEEDKNDNDDDEEKEMRRKYPYDWGNGQSAYVVKNAPWKM